MSLYLTEYEFNNKIIKDGKVEKVSSLKNFNEDIYSLIDGELIDIADELSAYIEAIIPIRHGLVQKN